VDCNGGSLNCFDRMLSSWYEGGVVAESLSRSALYELVWSSPLSVLCSRFGISDVALRKACKKAAIPTPERGYWARKEAGKVTSIKALPDRPPAMSVDVSIGGGHRYIYNHWTDEELLSPLPDPQEFEESLDTVRERVTKAVGHVSVPREVGHWHPSIQRLLNEDEKRRETQRTSRYPSFYDAPKLEVSFYDQNVWVKFGSLPKRRVKAEVPSGKTSEWISLSISDSSYSEVAIATWVDGDSAKVESELSRIAIECVFQAEKSYRSGVESRYEWRRERKSKLEEEIRQRKLRAIQAEQERLRKIEKERLDLLLRDADLFRQAQTLRSYVESVRSVQGLVSEFPVEKLEEWCQWVLREADRMDPIMSGKFLDQVSSIGCTSPEEAGISNSDRIRADA